MAYVREERRTGATVQTVEQARRRNAELRREFSDLTTEHATLQRHIDRARLQVSEARRLLTRKIRDLDAARAQVEHLPLAPLTGLPEPLHGGREGLLAAAAEMEAHEAKGVVPDRPRPVRKGPSHGTERRYRAGCRCDDCMGWRRRRSEQVRLVQQQRRNAQKRAA